jgi:hypothetical protein
VLAYLFTRCVDSEHNGHLSEVSGPLAPKFVFLFCLRRLDVREKKRDARANGRRRLQLSCDAVICRPAHSHIHFFSSAEMTTEGNPLPPPSRRVVAKSFRARCAGDAIIRHNIHGRHDFTLSPVNAHTCVTGLPRFSFFLVFLGGCIFQKITNIEKGICATARDANSAVI